MATVLLGNVSPLEAYKPDPKTTTVKTRTPDLGITEKGKPGPDGTITVVHTDSAPLEAASEIVGPWYTHHSDDPPEWVDSDNPLLAELLSQQFTRDDHECQVGRPKTWKAYGEPSMAGGSPELDLMIRGRFGDAWVPGISGLRAFLAPFWTPMGERILENGELVGLRVDTGKDLQSDNMGAGTSGDTGTSTGTTGTTLTDSGKSWTVNQWAGRVVFTGSVYGVIISNTATALTVDKWYAPATPGGAAASTPGTGVYVIGTAFQPAAWMALTANSGAPAAGDTVLTGEITTAGGGLLRALATYAHTTGAGTYTLTKTYTVNGSDTLPVTIAKIGIFNASGVVGRMAFETLLNATATLSAIGDQLQVTDTVTI